MFKLAGFKSLKPDREIISITLLDCLFVYLFRLLSLKHIHYNHIIPHKEIQQALMSFLEDLRSIVIQFTKNNFS